MASVSSQIRLCARGSPLADAVTDDADPAEKDTGSGRRQCAASDDRRLLGRRTRRQGRPRRRKQASGPQLEPGLASVEESSQS